MSCISVSRLLKMRGKRWNRMHIFLLRIFESLTLPPMRADAAKWNRAATKKMNSFSEFHGSTELKCLLLLCIATDQRAIHHKSQCISCIRQMNSSPLALAVGPLLAAGSRNRRAAHFVFDVRNRRSAAAPLAHRPSEMHST